MTQTATTNEESDRWLAVIGRSLAFLCLHHADLRDKDIGEQAELLEALGLARRDTAALLNSTEASVGELLRVRRKRSQEVNAASQIARAGGRGNGGELDGAMAHVSDLRLIAHLWPYTWCSVRPRQSGAHGAGG